MGTTPNLALPYPEGTDTIATTHVKVQNLATDLDNKLGGAWTAFTPSGSLDEAGANTWGRYRRIGRTIDAQGFIACTAAAAAGNVTINLPVAARTWPLYGAGTPPIGTAHAHHPGFTTVPGVCLLTGTGAFVIYSTSARNEVWTPTVPFTWANTSMMGFTISYEAAAS